MKLSTKGRYAVTALTHIVLNGRDAPVSLAEIAEAEDISVAYLEQLFTRLRKANLVDSFRGPGGGYVLARSPEEINVAEVMNAVDERLRATKCVGEVGNGCSGDRAQCLTHNLWEELSAHVYLFLNQKTLKDVADNKKSPCPAVPDFTALIELSETADTLDRNLL